MDTLQNKDQVQDQEQKSISTNVVEKAVDNSTAISDFEAKVSEITNSYETKIEELNKKIDGLISKMVDTTKKVVEKNEVQISPERREQLLALAKKIAK